MTHSCNHKCESDHYARCPTGPMHAFRTCRYCDGWKRCTTCIRAFLTPEIRCPCCSHVLRTAPRDVPKSLNRKPPVAMHALFAGEAQR